MLTSLLISSMARPWRLATFIVLFSSQTLLAEQFISANNVKFRYSGRVLHDGEQAFLTWPGTSVNFSFTGKQLAIVLEDKTGENYFNVIFNGDDRYPYVLHAKQGTHRYDLSHAITSDTSHITLFKRTEGAEGGTYFHGAAISENSQLLAPQQAPIRKIMFYGDSITVGMGNEAAHNDPDNKASEKNHYLSYAAITARRLNAEFHSIAKSGIGFMVSWFDFTMLDYYDQLTAHSNNNSAWNFDSWQPDVVVVNLGQNDRWLIENEKRLEATPDDIERAYEAFVRKLMLHHPNAQFICAIGSMDASQSMVWPNYIANAVSAIQSSPDNPQDKARVTTVIFEFSGYGAHPRIDQHVKNAAKLSAVIADKMNWSVVDNH
ncbi:GDSL-type esterase/lipase family protein [Alteromonas sp. D210916BOD_24]|uniref:GDSL-type esterase/lipase family protein n=1 Tax=Alteromonas sp. D210916BOD_24 TaxID=3157618 RepID=UPI00399C5C62